LRPDLYRKEPREKKEASVSQNEIIDAWFRLRDGMLIEGKTPTGARPPSLRDACYAYVLANRVASILTSEETIEAFVNGLEMGALSSLREAWEERDAWPEASAPPDPSA
jgi:hypothetical protein